VNAELVALRVAHDVGDRPAVIVRLDQARTELLQPFDLGQLALRLHAHIQMHPILGDLIGGPATHGSARR
jgi:hypothetical protein